MNFSTLRNNILPLCLRLLAQEGTDQQCFDLPPVTPESVLRQLGTLPPIKEIRVLQAQQEGVTTGTEVEEKLQAFCFCAGRPLVRAFEILEDLRHELESSCSVHMKLYSKFCDHSRLRDALVQLDESLSLWEESIGTEEFFREHTKPRDVRYQYLEHTLHIIFVIAVLTLPDAFSPHKEEFESVLQQENLREQLILDSEITYARSKKRGRMEIIAPQNQTPRRYIPYGMTVRRPYLVHNQGIHGHFLEVNQKCSRADPPQAYLNLGRFNSWYLYRT